jgi:hypothetical protein
MLFALFSSDGLDVSSVRTLSPRFMLVSVPNSGLKGEISLITFPKGSEI